MNENKRQENRTVIETETNSSDKAQYQKQQVSKVKSDRFQKGQMSQVTYSF